jgi:hypothetical protein
MGEEGERERETERTGLEVLINYYQEKKRK